MQRITVRCNGFTGRWAGGEFITVHRTEREDEHVPDAMIRFPEEVKRSRGSAADLERALRAWTEEV